MKKNRKKGGKKLTNEDWTKMEKRMKKEEKIMNERKENIKKIVQNEIPIFRD